MKYWQLIKKQNISLSIVSLWDSIGSYFYNFVAVIQEVKQLKLCDDMKILLALCWVYYTTRCLSSAEGGFLKTGPELVIYSLVLQ